MNGEYRAFGDHGELGVGDHHGDLKHPIRIRIEPAHFHVQPN